MKILSPFIIIILFALLTISSGVSFVSAFKLPSDPLSTIAYNRVYQEPPYTEAYYCVALANQKYSLRKLLSPQASIAGCLPPNYIQTLPLYTFDYDAWRDIAFNRNFDSFDNIAADLVAKRKPNEPFLSAGNTNNEGPFAIVIPPNFANSDATKRRFTCGFIFGLLRRLQQAPYNLPLQGIYTFYNTKSYTNQSTKASSAPLNNVCDLSGFASSSPLYDQSPYKLIMSNNNAVSINKKSWNNQNPNQQLLDGIMWGTLTNSSMTVVEIDFTSSSTAETFYTVNLYQKAKFNTQQKQADSSLLNIAADFVTQNNAAMFVVATPLTAADVNAPNKYSCIEKQTCLPLGGLSVFASTRRQETPRIDLNNDRGSSTSSPAAQITQTTTSASDWKKKFRFRRSVAVIIPSTSTDSMFHESVPAANAAASGIVGGIALIDALSADRNIQKLLTTQVSLNYKNSLGTTEQITWEPTQVHFLFAVGDEYGLIGTGRFITELLTFNCSVPTRSNQTDLYKRICSAPLYGNLNFTAVDLAEYTHVFALEQLALGDNIYLHTDGLSNIATSSPSPATLATGKGYYGGTFNFSTSTAQQNMRNYFSSSSSAVLSSEAQLPPNGLFAFYEAASTKNALLRDASLSSGVLDKINPFEKRWNGQFNDTVLATISAYDASYSDPAFQSQGDVASRLEVLNSNPTQLIQKGAQSIANFLVDLWINELQDFINGVSGSNADANVTSIVSGFTGLPALVATLRSSSVARVNLTTVQKFWNCLGAQSASACSDLSTVTFKSYYPSVFSGSLATASLSQRIIAFYIQSYLSKLDFYGIAGGTTTTTTATTTTTTTTVTPAPSSPTTAAPSSGACGRTCYWTEYCSDDSLLCLPNRVWYMSAFSTLADYALSASAPAFLNATPTQLKKDILPRVLIDEDLVPLWTESFWNTLEMRSGQRQVYNANGFLMGIAWVVTVVVGVLSFLFMKYCLQ